MVDWPLHGGWPWESLGESLVRQGECEVEDERIKVEMAVYLRI